MHRTTQEPGQAPREERINYDGEGRRLDGSGAGADRRIEGNRVEEVKDEDDAGKQYEERMEDEYAKKEGGA